MVGLPPPRVRDRRRCLRHRRWRGLGDPPVDERRTKLDWVASNGDRFSYTYDFGDDWEHRIEVEGVVPIDPDGAYPRCVAGRRSAPPEDVGGPWSYAGFLEAIADPNHDEHDGMLEWAGGTFDPERCDLVEINARLTPIRRR